MLIEDFLKILRKDEYINSVWYIHTIGFSNSNDADWYCKQYGNEFVLKNRCNDNFGLSFLYNINTTDCKNYPFFLPSGKYDYECMSNKYLIDVCRIKSKTCKYVYLKFVSTRNFPKVLRQFKFYSGFGFMHAGLDFSTEKPV